ncbi:MAG: M28 family peptidase [Prevotellaceae bacterium]|jgi:Zn-dependent M28 family amino/carboxypeptidase|nr:M28 family peptidase [Prevotellaceae bacterium]
MNTSSKISLLATIGLFLCFANIKAQSDSALIINHLKTITKTDGYRNYSNIPLLDKTADYIFSVFKKYADTTYFQPYQVEGRRYKNVICRFNTTSTKPLIVVGAHYDVCGDQEGADDNASGVVGLLELARLLSGKKMNHPVEIVAYTLEEPPYFRSEYMGSYIHAKSLYESNVSVYGMVVLEMIGYFDDKSKSQHYPVKIMKVKYGTTGNFILLARKTGAREFAKRFSNGFKDIANIDARSLKAPSKIQGIDFSDHLNYWHFGFDALMVTNTAFYRNHNYHQSTDTVETLDIDKMMKVIDTTFNTLVNL